MIYHFKGTLTNGSLFYQIVYILKNDSKYNCKDGINLFYSLCFEKS